MKFRIALGLDLEILTPASHLNKLEGVLLKHFASSEGRFSLTVNKATAIISFEPPGHPNAWLDQVLDDLKPLTHYRWVNINKEA